METTIKNFYQNRIPSALRAGKPYSFYIPHVHFDEKNDKLTVIFALKDAKTDIWHYLLDAFDVNSERYKAFIKDVYSEELLLGMVVSIDYEDLKRYSGECFLTLEDGRLVVDVDILGAETKPFSHIWNEQADGVNYWTTQSYHPKTYKVESKESSDPSYNSPPLFVQPSVYQKLHPGTKYNFKIKKCRFKTPDVLQLVIALYGDDDEPHYFLDELELNSERFKDFLSHAYSVDVDSGMVVEFAPEDLCDVFSGSCELEQHKGSLRINWGYVELWETLHSRIYDEQLAAQKGGDK